MRRIAVDVPPSEPSRVRVEPRVFERVDAIRAAARAERHVAPRRRSAMWIAAGGLAVAAVAVVVLGRGPAQPPSAPSLVVTPPGGSSRFTVDDAVIDAGGDTSVEVQTGPGGAATLVLARGTVDCDIAPRHGRPFRVIAGDVSVDVIGTRFSVARDPSVRVDVTHGQVRVRAPGGEWSVGPGERWPEPVAPSVPPPRPAAAQQELELPADPVHPPVRPVATSSRDGFLAAQRLEAADWSAAARSYRAVASGDDRWSALALYSLAELMSSHERAHDALAALDEYRRRFPRGASAEDVAWLRVTTLRALGKTDDARRAAAEYLRQFPRGTYADAAARLAPP